MCFLLSDLCFYITKCLYFQIIRLCHTESSPILVLFFKKGGY
nr:MAG TPA: hypothetical protein [Caudoviricetes sp.]